MSTWTWGQSDKILVDKGQKPWSTFKRLSSHFWKPHTVIMTRFHINCSYFISLDKYGCNLELVWVAEADNHKEVILVSVSSLSFHPTDQCPSKSHQNVAVLILTADINFTVWFLPSVWTSYMLRIVVWVHVEYANVTQVLSLSVRVQVINVQCANPVYFS